MKRRCRSMRHGWDSVFECDRKYGHKGKHRTKWREGVGDQVVKIVARWP